MPPPGAATPPPFASSSGAGPANRAALAARNKVSGLLTVVGAAALIVATFLPWAGIEADLADQLNFKETASGWSTLDGDVGDGPIFLVLGLAIIVMGGLALRGVVKLGTKIATIVAGVFSLLFVLIEFASIADDSDELAQLGFSDALTYEFGLFVLLLGAILGLVGGCLFRRKVN